MHIEKIRNFSIIAHIDHGKSTLADRFIQLCGQVDERDMENQLLDSMDIERERGITIKSQAVSLKYKDYFLNFIDTPGHVDFSYEVSRSLAACEGALLVVDAAQGVEAQSIANCYTAIEQNLEIISVLNKIDLPQAEPERVKQEIEDIIGLDSANAIECSAKNNINIEKILDTIIACVPAPKTNTDASLRALVIDSWFDNYLGIVSLVRIVDGKLSAKDRVVFHSIGKSHIVQRVGVFTPAMHDKEILYPGEVGFVITGIKEIHGAPVGDTLMSEKSDAIPLTGFVKAKPRMYAGIFPTDSNDYRALCDSLEKLALNDASLLFEVDSSDALGLGFRVGFLGMLHMEITQERLEREYNLDLIISCPNVAYRVTTKNKKVIMVAAPSKMPDAGVIEMVEEPMAEVNILTDKKYLGNIMTLCLSRRGVQRDIQYSGNQASIDFIMPLAEVLVDLFDQIKSTSCGFASMDYQVKGFQQSSVVRLDILINGEVVDALAMIIHKENAQFRGRKIANSLKEVIPRQMFDVAIQAAIGRTVIARTTVKSLRKNVTSKCYGGDITRKKKLLEKQKAGKKRLKKFGRVEIPQEAFFISMRHTKEES